MRVTIIDLDQPTRYQYSDDILQHIVDSINDPDAPCNLVYTEPFKQTLDKVCAMMTDARIEGRRVTAKLKLIDTPIGKVLKDVLNQDAKLSFSICGVGTLSEGDVVSQERYQFKSVVVDVI